MQVTSNELNAIKVVALGRASIIKLGNFLGKDVMLEQFRQAKKAWWKNIREKYSLAGSRGSRRLAVELDGDRAGELRYKARDPDELAVDPQRRVVHLETQAQGQAAQTGSPTPGVDVVALAASLRETFASAGIPLDISMRGASAAGSNGAAASH